jgi:hypothetical protein
VELQNRFQGHCEKEFGILGLDDRLPGFSDWERKLGLWTGGHVVTIGPLVKCPVIPFLTCQIYLIFYISILSSLTNYNESI